MNNSEFEKEIVYEDELVSEVVDTGTYILDGLYKTPEQQRAEIIAMAREKGIEISDDEELEIGYEGADDDYGISETQSTKYVITRKVSKKVPYAMSREVIDEDIYILDGLYKTPEQQRAEIIARAREKGVNVDNPEELEIGYEGADDDYGISETQSTKYVIYRVKKRKLTDEEAEKLSPPEEKNNVELNSYSDINDEEVVEKTEAIHKELISLKKRLVKASDPNEIIDISGHIDELAQKYQQIVDDSKGKYKLYEDEIREYDRLISTTQQDLLKYIQEYEDTFEELKRLIEEEKKQLDSDIVLSDEEIENIRTKNLEKKGALSSSLETIKNKIDILKKELSGLKTKKTKVEGELEQAMSFGISAEEYREIMSSLKKRKLMDAILEAKGLTDIVKLPVKERTEDQKKKLREARDDIYSEVIAAHKVSDKSLEEIIQILYNIDTSAVMAGTPREEKMSEADLDNLKRISRKAPQKIRRPDDSDMKNRQGVAGPAPSDMIDAYTGDNGAMFSGDASDEVDDTGDSGSGDNSDVDSYEDDSDMKNRQGVAGPAPSDMIDAYTGDNGAMFSGDASDEVDDTGDNSTGDNAEVDSYEDDSETLRKIRDAIDILERSEARFDEARKKLDEAGYGPGGNDVSDEVKRELYKAAEEDYANAKKDLKDLLEKYQDDPEIGPLVKNLISEVEKKIADEEELVNNRETDNVINLYIDMDNDGKIYVERSVLDEFGVTPSSDEAAVIDGKECYPIDKFDAGYLVGNAEHHNPPYRVMYDNVHLNDLKKQENNLESQEGNDDLVIDTVVIYKDINDGKLYANKYVFKRFDYHLPDDSYSTGRGIIYPLMHNQAEEIENNQNNDVSPYRVVYEDIEIEKDNTDDMGDDDKNIETITIFKDINDGKLYARKYVFDRFSVDLPEDGYETDGKGIVYEISSDDVAAIENNQNNDVSPYRVVYEDIEIEKKKTDDGQDIPVYVVYQDEDSGKYYAQPSVFDTFGFDHSDDTVAIEGNPCFEMKQDDFDDMYERQNDEQNPYRVVVKKVNLKKQEHKREPHVEEILDKLTDGLNIKSKDGKRFTASNIKVAKNFREELRSGSVLYNVVHVVPAIIKAGVSLLRKLAAKIMLSARGKSAMQEIKARLNGESDDEHNITEEELEVLFKKYKGSQLKTDMNNQINPLILEKLREYGLQKVAKLNDIIKQNYAMLFSIVGQIDALKEKLQSNVSDEEKETYREQLHSLYVAGSGYVRVIVDSRTEADNILSSGVHGIEEDFKAVATKLSYVGKRFAKGNDFDNELQHKLGQFGKNLNIALDEDNPEAVVDNFLGLEKCYYENTEIHNSVFGKRSTGSKYYSPLAEQFDYRDDPFIRDMFTTIAVASAAISTINAIRVHQIEDKQLLQQQQNEAHRVNSANDQTIGTVHNVGRQISGKRGTFREGMEAQAHQDVLNVSGTQERIDLDMTDWSFNGQYHAADAASHQMWNQMNSNVQSQLNNVSSQYAQGAITQAQALQQMTQIANGAQRTLDNVINNGINMCMKYARSHPQHDLTGVIDSMKYISAHPNAIINMNQAMVDVTNMADTLSSLQITHMTALSSLPSDMVTTIVSAASAAVLAANVASNMQSRHGSKGYGNEVTDMMDEYVEGMYGSDEAEDNYSYGR